MADTTDRGIIYPTSNDVIIPLETIFAALAQSADDAISDLEPQTIRVFENTAERDAAPTPPPGSFSYVKSNNIPYYYNGTEWRTFVPTSLPASVITSGVFDTARIPANINITGNAATATTATTASTAFSADFATTASTASFASTAGSAPVADNSVTTAKIVNQAVTTAKIENLAVGSGKLADGAVTSAKLGTDSVTTGKIEAQAVTTGKIANNAIGNGKINNTDDFTMSTVQVTGTAGFRSSNGVSRVNSAGQMFPNSATGTSTPVHQDGVSAVLTRSTSSRRYKLFEEELNTHLDILNLVPKTWIDKAEYERNGSSTDGLIRYPGFIAEDLDEAGMEMFVHHNPDGSAESIDYGRLVAAIIPVLKNYQDRISQLENKLMEKSADE